MRATLEQLKAMSDDELRIHWKASLFPFDGAECGLYVTEHTYLGLQCIRHRNFFQEATGLLGSDFYAPEEMMKFRASLDELYALRLFFDPYYKKETTDAVEETVQEEKVSV